MYTLGEAGARENGTWCSFGATILATLPDQTHVVLKPELPRNGFEIVEWDGPDPLKLIFQPPDELMLADQVMAEAT